MAAQASSSNSANARYESPSTETLAEADALEVLDEKSERHSFKSLYQPDGAIRKCLIVFIRHFSCGSCESYVKALSAHTLFTKTPDLLVILIGCGQPSIVPDYRSRTKTNFKIYCDPTRALYSKLGMTSNIEQGDKQPAYITDPMWKVTAKAVPNVIKSGFNFSTREFNNGNFAQNGGEWYFDDGELQWCHRMRHTRDHAELSELDVALGLKQGGDSENGLERKNTEDQRKDVKEEAKV